MRRALETATYPVTSRGRITIPKDVRERLRLRKGDRLAFLFAGNGDLVLKPARAKGVDSLVGFLHRFATKRPATLREMKQAVTRHAARDFRRSVAR